jgi:hypothetical protein
MTLDLFKVEQGVNEGTLPPSNHYCSIFTIMEFHHNHYHNHYHHHHHHHRYSSSSSIFITIVIIIASSSPPSSSSLSHDVGDILYHKFVHKSAEEAAKTKSKVMI